MASNIYCDPPAGPDSIEMSPDLFDTISIHSGRCPLVPLLGSRQRAAILEIPRCQIWISTPMSDLYLLCVKVNALLPRRVWVH